MRIRAPLILGTHNRKKGAELARLLAPMKLAVCTLDDYPSSIDVIEDGDSFASNAAKKAIQQARHLRAWVLGEDSGICVDALRGGPGIFSARFSGPTATDQSNNEKLLDQLGDLPLAKRTAYYTCHMVVSDPQGQIQAESCAHCRGRILFAEEGQNGFGYDPLFQLLEYRRTFGQLGPVVKSALSHRARATAALLPQIRELVRLDQISESGM